MNITSAEAITRVTVEQVDTRTVVVAVESTLPISLLWPYVRANHDVPEGVRRVSVVFPAPPSDKDARDKVLDDVAWREDRGYVSYTASDGGYMFAWRDKGGK